MVLCCWGGEAERNERVLPDVRRSTPGKIHLLTGPQHGQTRLKLVKKGNGLRRGMEHTMLIFFLDTGFSHATPFTDLPSHNVLSAERCGGFCTPLPAAVRLCCGCAFIEDELGGRSR